MDHQATGTFEVDREAQPAEGDPAIGRMTLAKRYKGDLEGSALGQMLAHMTGVPGSAGYVAIERFVGTLHGRSGSFALQHSGTMTRGAATLSVTVVPDSGTGELVGLSGRMGIRLDASTHHYDFEYSLDPPAA